MLNVTREVGSDVQTRFDNTLHYDEVTGMVVSDAKLITYYASPIFIDDELFDEQEHEGLPCKSE